MSIYSTDSKREKSYWKCPWKRGKLKEGIVQIAFEQTNVNEEEGGVKWPGKQKEMKKKKKECSGK